MTRPSAARSPRARETVTGLTRWRSMSDLLEGSRSPGRSRATAPRNSAASVAILLSCCMKIERSATASESITLLGLGLACLGVLAFSFTFPATVLALDGLDPYLIGVGRAAAASVLAAVALMAARAARPRGGQWAGLAAA